MIGAIVQARMLSKRLPGKVLKEILGKPVIGHVLERLSRSKKIDRIVLATSVDKSNDPLEAYVRSIGTDVFRGSEEDVLDRYYQCAKEFGADVIVRVTADCPLLDHRVVDQVIARFLKEKADYVSNVVELTFPDGLDTEVFSMAALSKAWKEAKAQGEREHVTTLFRQSDRFSKVNVANETDLSTERWTVDYAEDFKVITAIFAALHPRDPDFGMQDVLKFKREHPEVFAINKDKAYQKVSK